MRVLAVALDHHLVTRLTSLVAVDQTPSRPDGARLTRAEIRSTCGRLGFRQGVRRRAFVCAGAGGTACRRRAGGMRSWQPRRRGGVERAQASGSEVRIGAPRRRDLPPDRDPHGAAVVDRPCPVRRWPDPHADLAPPASRGALICAMTLVLPVVPRTPDPAGTRADAEQQEGNHPRLPAPPARMQPSGCARATSSAGLQGRRGAAPAPEPLPARRRSCGCGGSESCVRSLPR